MHFTLTIEASNEDMATGDDIARAINGVAQDIRHSNLTAATESGTVRDAKGVAVGTWKYDR